MIIRSGASHYLDLNTSPPRSTLLPAPAKSCGRSANSSRRADLPRPKRTYAHTKKERIINSLPGTGGGEVRTERVRWLMLRTSPQPNNAHRRAAPTELHAFAGPFTISVLARGCLFGALAATAAQERKSHHVRASSAHRHKRPSQSSRSPA
jgi:hypothetical protein